MTITAYDTINSLAETYFIGGTDKVLTFAAYAEDGVTLLNITAATIQWLLCPFGVYSEPLVTKSGVPIDAYHFTVTLDAADTLYLAGRYIQQVIITDFSGNEFRPAQGWVIISPAVGVSTTVYWPSATSGIYNVGGNIGIGNSNPQYNLDVLGTINASGTITGNALSINGLFTSDQYGNTLSSSLMMPEITAPAAPPANDLILYALDNGSGKTQLMVKFHTGAAQQIAIQA